MQSSHLFGIAAIIASIALLFSSVEHAFASPNGPNVSLGANPIEVAQVNCSNQSPTLFTTGNDAFIITDLIVADGYSTGGITLQLNGSNWLSFAENRIHAFSSGIPVPINSTLAVQCSYGRTVTISGYYAHP